MKQILCINRHSPYDSALAREALDAILAAATFDQDISVLWMDDGVYQLLATPEDSNAHNQSIAKPLAALNLYGVEKIYVHSPSLQERGIEVEQLLLPTLEHLDDAGVKALIARQDQLLSF